MVAGVGRSVSVKPRLQEMERIVAGYASLERAEAVLRRFDEQVGQERPGLTLEEAHAVLEFARAEFACAKRLLGG